MSWNLLVYAIPSIFWISALLERSPNFYSEYERLSLSEHDQIIKTVIRRIFQQENKPGALYYKRIQEMFTRLPKEASGDKIKSWLEHRLKVVSIDQEFIKAKGRQRKIDLVGTDQDGVRNQKPLNGTFYMAIKPDLEPEVVNALAWLATREIYQILEKNMEYFQSVIIISTLAVSILSTFVFGWGLLASFSAVCIVGGVLLSLSVFSQEQRADDFANTHCTPEEKRNALIYFEKITKNRAADSRIEKIEASLKENANVAT